MTEYLMYFNQQWVGDHTEEWFRGRGPLAMAVVDEMKAAGVYVFAGGLEEETDTAFSADATDAAKSADETKFSEETKAQLKKLRDDLAALEARSTSPCWTSSR